MKVLVLHSTTTDPKTNLDMEVKLCASVSNEQYILRFWHNSPALIMGRFQNREFEVNEDYIFKNKLPVLKRHTGGGTVYHDEGTLNITFIKPKNPLLSKQFKKDSDYVTDLIVQALNSLGINAKKDERNSVFLDNKKILGSAVSLTGDVFCYHASLLYNTNLEHLNQAINWSPNYQEKKQPYVKSHRSPVINVKSIYPSIQIEQIKVLIEEKVCKIFAPFLGRQSTCV